jgi:hypothetical protein
MRTKYLALMILFKYCFLNIFETQTLMVNADVVIEDIEVSQIILNFINHS